MKTIAVEDTFHAKLLKLKNTVSRDRGRPVTFSELLEEIIRRPLGSLLIDNILMDAIRHFIKQISQNDSVQGVILFGSVAKGIYHEYSDIDLFILVKKADSETFDFMEKTSRNTEKEFFALLHNNKLPLHFSPFIYGKEQVDFDIPIFFDIADGGLILFDRNLAASEFIDKYMSIPHSRKFSESGEILKW